MRNLPIDTFSMCQEFILMRHNLDHLTSEFWDNPLQYLFIFIFRKSRSPGKRSSRSPSRSPGRSTFGSDENDRVNNNNDAVGNNGESWRE